MERTLNSSLHKRRFSVSSLEFVLVRMPFWLYGGYNSFEFLSVIKCHLHDEYNLCCTRGYCFVVPYCGSVIENMNSDVRTDRDAHAVSKKMAFYPFDMPPGFEFQKIYICAKSS